jgi:hypothetical protein
MLAYLVSYARQRRNTQRMVLAEKETHAEETAMRNAATQQCDYCKDREAEGFVPQYKARVCVQCYEDHHGPVI